MLLIIKRQPKFSDIKMKKFTRAKLERREKKSPIGWITGIQSHLVYILLIYFLSIKIFIHKLIVILHSIFMYVLKTLLYSLTIMAYAVSMSFYITYFTNSIWKSFEIIPIFSIIFKKQLLLSNIIWVTISIRELYFCNLKFVII